MKRTNLKKRHVFIAIILLLCAIILALTLMQKKINILGQLQDGMSDPDSLTIYADAVEAVNKGIVRSGMDLWYYNCDLNNDGNIDKITIISCFGWGGSGGEPLRIWIGDGEGHYTVAGGILDYFIYQGSGKLVQNKKIYISNNMTNGYRDLEFVFPGNRFKMQYNIDVQAYVRTEI